MIGFCYFPLNVAMYQIWLLKNKYKLEICFNGLVSIVLSAQHYFGHSIDHSFVPNIFC